ncbi:MAG: hypothetical protein ACQ9MH_05190 [Nitrospinales bacterium]
MRKPSKQMPKRPPTMPTTPMDVFWRVVILGGCLWGLFKALKFFWESGFTIKSGWDPPLVILLVLLFFSFSIAIMVMTRIHDKKWRSQLNDLAEEREGESICTFSRHFNCREVDTWIIRAVYEELQDEIYAYENFPIRPGDKFILDLGISEDNLEDDVYEDIAGRAGRSWENCESNPYYNKVDTVENLIHFFNHQPKIA